MGRSWFLPILVAGIVALGVAMLGGTITDLGPWYQTLSKPEWTPPGYVFPIAWTAIFALAALAAVGTWLSAPNANARTTTIGLFALNGFLNILWSLLFFRLGLRRTDRAVALRAGADPLLWTLFAPRDAGAGAVPDLGHHCRGTQLEHRPAQRPVLAWAQP